MNIVFEKIPFEDYLAFFQTIDIGMGAEVAGPEMTAEDINLLRIQYDYLKEPSWVKGSTYELYCPINMHIGKSTHFAIPTGFRCKSYAETVRFIANFEEIVPMSRIWTIHNLEKHIVIQGVMRENRCFVEGQPLVKLVFQ